jgi:hypothetical protein
MDRRQEVVMAEVAPDDRPSAAAELTALDVRGEHRVLAAFSDEELAAVPLLREGAPLGRYRLYLDLHDPARADFAAEGSERVKPGQRLVARDATDPALWDQLRRACENVVGRARAG